MTISSEELADLKTKHGRIVHMKDEDDGEVLWEAVFRVPNKREFDTYQAKVDQGLGSKGMEQLTRQIVVWPSSGEFDSLYDKFPAMHVSLGNDDRFKKLIGAGATSQRK